MDTRLNGRTAGPAWLAAQRAPGGDRSRRRYMPQFAIGHSPQPRSGTVSRCPGASLVQQNTAVRIAKRSPAHVARRRRPAAERARTAKRREPDRRCCVIALRSVIVSLGRGSSSLAQRSPNVVARGGMDVRPGQSVIARELRGTAFPHVTASEFSSRPPHNLHRP